MAKVIPLGRGYVAWVDDEDFEDLARFVWHVAIRSGARSAYAVRTLAGGSKEYMHRRIMKTPGPVDHVKHYPLVVDNRRANLRPATNRDNSSNARKKVLSRGPTTSPFKGVCLDKHGKKWQVQIRLGAGRRVHLGTFANEGYAALVFDLAAVKTAGPYALTNFPVPGSSNWMYGP